MDFAPAGEIIGKLHRVRTVRISQSPMLPDGEYCFIDKYCTDPSCDCRKTMIEVIHNGKFVSLINYGWESPEFYQRWMGDSELEQIAPMSGASVDISSPDRVSSEGILGLFQALLNEEWKKAFKTNYSLVKRRLGKGNL